jgi:hypothetical protein
MRNTSTVNGKVVVNRSMSLDGFIAGPGHGDLGEAVATARGAAGGKNLTRTGLEPVSSERPGAVTILRFRVRR